jgi:hypothetical protein
MKMKHPAWCDEDDCESGWHMRSATYSNSGLARIEVRLCQDIKTGAFELDLGDTTGSYNSEKDIAYEASQLREFANTLITLLDAIEAKKKVVK